jgi:DNA-directed RNA polymerase specialized sigma24 family protein
MPDEAQHAAAHKAVEAAQRRYESESAAAQKARQKAFAMAQKEGLSLREIGKSVGLHHSRAAEIIRGE